MATIFDRLKKIIVDQLGVEEAEVIPPPNLLMIWALIHWTW